MHVHNLRSHNSSRRSHTSQPTQYPKSTVTIKHLLSQLLTTVFDILLATMIPTIFSFTIFFSSLSLSAAEFPTPDLPNSLPMEKYQVDNDNGDAACPSSVNQTALYQARLLTMKKNAELKTARSLEEFEAGMREIWDDEDEGIQVIVPVAGTYTGIQNIIEYSSIVAGSLNNGYVSHYDTAVSNLEYFPTNSSFAFQVAQKL